MASAQIFHTTVSENGTQAPEERTHAHTHARNQVHSVASPVPFPGCSAQSSRDPRSGEADVEGTHGSKPSKPGLRGHPPADVFFKSQGVYQAKNTATQDMLSATL